ncbi:PREDICTED: apoptotic chromatin condensation inducer in the nucleus-like [Rhagoletis zephyria]|uniref:apoptotic chromatin condensation inducer in the nucleus-like n=1 Tax=Rhagoletis zephyria TaxID=28612 RepID=UPI000811588E|nr:PREDICTED: apoptotic chromatin condensation inducer in the nucleus-like [Rhagoletis zephyria]
MAENILIDGKPLHLLRVVDLREELKKRNIKTTGTKLQLQESLIKAVTHEQELAKGIVDNCSGEFSSCELMTSLVYFVGSAAVSEAPEVTSVPENVVDKEPASNADNNNSGGSTDDNNSAENSDSESKVASISINEQNETIKLTIRSSPKKGEQSQPALEANDSETDESESADSRDHSPVNKSNLESSPDVVDEAGDQANSIEKSSSVNESHNKHINENHAVDPQDNSHSDTLAADQMNENNVSVDQSQNQSTTTSIVDKSKGSKPSIRGRLLSHSKSINEEDSSKPVQKKRRWGSSHVSGESTTIAKKGISSDELKQLISESVTENETSAAKVSKVAAVTEEDSVTVPVDSTNDLTNNNNNNEKTEPKEVEVKKVDVANTEKTNSSESDANRAPPSPKGEKSDEMNAERTVASSKNPESTVLFISGLVRPYTLPQLKKLLCLNGLINEEKFWIDKIKSKCYAVYSTVEEAVKTREALHGLKWPQSSPKDLCVEFATLEDIDRCLNPENYENLPPPRKSSPPAAKQAKQSDANDKPKRGTAIEISKGKYDIIQNEPIHDGKDGTGKNSAKDDASSRNVREWDRKKVTLTERKENNDEQESRKRSRPSTENDQDAPADKRERIRSRTPEKKKSEPARDAKKSESPAKMLEDLFRKTKAMPYIYWLPLSYEQAADKAKKRELLEKERLERVARRDADSKRETTNFPPPPPPPANRSVPVNADIVSVTSLCTNH